MQSWINLLVLKRLHSLLSVQGGGGHDGAGGRHPHGGSLYSQHSSKPLSLEHHHPLHWFLWRRREEGEDSCFLYRRGAQRQEGRWVEHLRVRKERHSPFWCHRTSPSFEYGLPFRWIRNGNVTFCRECVRRQAGPTCSSQETDFSLLNVYLQSPKEKLKTRNAETHWPYNEHEHRWVRWHWWTHRSRSEGRQTDLTWNCQNPVLFFKRFEKKKIYFQIFRVCSKAWYLSRDQRWHLTPFSHNPIRVPVQVFSRL